MCTASWVTRMGAHRQQRLVLRCQGWWVIRNFVLLQVQQIEWNAVVRLKEDILPGDFLQGRQPEAGQLLIGHRLDQELGVTWHLCKHAELGRAGSCKVF